MSTNTTRQAGEILAEALYETNKSHYDDIKNILRLLLEVVLDIRNYIRTPQKLTEQLGRALDEWEAKEGAFTNDELAEAKRALKQTPPTGVDVTERYFDLCLSQFFRLLHEAHAASESVDAYDLDGEDLGAHAEFEGLRLRQALAGAELVHFCTQHSNGIMGGLKRSGLFEKETS